VTYEVKSPPAGDIPKLNFSIQICLVSFSVVLIHFIIWQPYFSFHYGIHH